MVLSLGAVIIISYLLGAIPSSLWAGKIYKSVDIRNHGSGNAGATNTFRLLGWKAGVIVSLVDLGKGFVAAYYVSELAYIITGDVPSLQRWETETFIQLIAGVTAVIGHMFPVYANFSGGKGVMAAAGMLLAIEPISIVVSIFVFIVVLFSSRYVSLASILAAFFYPITLLILRYAMQWSIDGSLIIFGTFCALAIIIKHHGNIKRLMQGNENRVRSFSPATGWLNKDEQNQPTS